jgi:hypothetical protein
MANDQLGDGLPTSDESAATEKTKSGRKPASEDDPRGWECPGPQARYLILHAPVCA